MLRSIHSSLAAQQSQASHFTWILVDGRDLCCLEEFGDFLEGSLALMPQYPVVEGLQDRFSWFTKRAKSYSSLSSATYFKTPCAEAWNQMPSNSGLCELPRRHGNDLLPWQQQEEIQAIVNGLFMFVHAFKRLVDISCQEMPIMNQCQGKLRGSSIFEELKKGVSEMYRQTFKAFSLQPRMKENTFSLVNVQKSQSGYWLVPVGTWERAWFIDRQGLRWNNGSDHTPVSFCGVPCEPGYIRVSKKGRKCCWSCLPCSYKQYVKDNYTCADCLRGYWPSVDFRECEFQWRRTLFACIGSMIAMVLVFSCMVL